MVSTRIKLLIIAIIRLNLYAHTYNDIFIYMCIWMATLSAQTALKSFAIKLIIVPLDLERLGLTGRRVRLFRFRGQSEKRLRMFVIMR